MYTLVTTPDPILVNKAHKVTSFDQKLKAQLDEMKETLLATTDPVGVGLAAPQVGIPQKIFLMKPKADSPITVFINPEIVSSSEIVEVPNFTNSEKVESKKPKKGKLLEGCLSIPNIWGHVTRKKEVTITWHDENGKKHKRLFKGFPAVIVQHEMDHLEGILFTKHVMSQNETLYKSHKNAEGEEEFDEVKI